jgi:hypothetical protein
MKKKATLKTIIWINLNMQKEGMRPFIALFESNLNN